MGQNLKGLVFCTIEFQDFLVGELLVYKSSAYYNGVVKEHVSVEGNGKGWDKLEDHQRIF